MAIPNTYTEDELAVFMDSILAGVADVLEWSPAGGDYAESVNEALLAYGTDDISTITGLDNIKKLRALARREVWRSVMSATAADYDFSADGGRYSRSMIHKMATDNFLKAEAETMIYDSNYQVGIDTVTHKHDPYQYLPEDERTL